MCSSPLRDTGSIQPSNQLIQRIFRSRAGSPAIEFALLAPVMIFLLTGTYDVIQLLIAQRRIVSTAQQIVEIATELSIQPDQSLSLTTAQVYQAETAIYAMIPGLKSGSDTNKFWVTLSAVVYTGTPAGCVSGVNCTYVANTAWSSALPQSATPLTRPCGIIPQVAATQQSAITNLPTADMTVLTSIVVADVSYTYLPLFTGFVTGPVKLQTTAFLPPRAGTVLQYVQYDLANAKTNPSVCPGFL
jgi:Flp pilus assembly protein TadG